MRPSSLILLALACSGVAISPAFAQNALGNGRGLERDLRVGGGGLTPREDFGAIVRYRNAVVTGQAPGGSSLKINPGYTDSSAFTARLGSDDLYRFRRDSLYSGLGGMGFRGTESLQYQFSFSTGNTKRTSDPYILQRGSGATALSGADRGSQASYSAYQLAEGSRAGTLRSTSTFAANQGLKPVVIGYRTVQGQAEPVASSSLLGIKSFSARAYDAPKEPTGAKPSDRAKGGLPNEVKDSAAPNSAAPEPAKTAHDELRERLNTYAPEMFKQNAEPSPSEDASSPSGKPKTNEPSSDKGSGDSTKKSGLQPGSTSPAGGTKPTDKQLNTTPDAGTSSGKTEKFSATTEWQRRMNELRRTMRPEATKRSGAGTNPDDTKAPADPNAPKDPKAKSSVPDPLKLDAFTQRFDKDTLALIRRAGDEETKRYIAGVQSGGIAPRDVYGNAMTAGEKFMKTEQYFDAEERFAFALSMKSGDPTAQAGRVHAQLGSGLHVSAASNLRNLLEQHPDTAGMRYSLDIMPALVRQRQLIAQLRANIDGTDSSGPRIPRESALLLAYLGYQRSDPAIVREGIDALKQNAPKSDEAFIAFIEGVWLPTAAKETK